MGCNLLHLYYARRLLLQSLLRERRQDEARLVDLGVVIAAQALLLLGGPRALRHAHVAAGLLAAHHEPDLARGVRRDRRVGVLGHGEHLAAVLLQLRDELEVEPLVLSYFQEFTSVTYFSSSGRINRVRAGG